MPYNSARKFGAHGGRALPFPESDLYPRYPYNPWSDKLFRLS